MNISVSNQTYFANSRLPDAHLNQSGIGLRHRFAQIEKSGENACYDRISAKYLGMDSVAKFVTRVFCENQQRSLNVGKVYLSNQGIHGMREALGQNSNLRSLQISVDCLEPDIDCLTTFAHDFSSALIENRELNFFRLNLNTAAVGRSLLATQEFISNLPCFNLGSLAIEGPIGSPAAHMFPDILSQKFPLTNFSWDTGISSTDPSASDLISSFSNGISKNRCIKALDLSPNNCDAAAIKTLFRGVGSSRIETFYLPQFVNEDGYNGPYVFTDEQEAAIIESVKSNSCLLRCIPHSEYASLPQHLASVVDNITQTRTPCLPDPECRIPASCSVFNPPSPSPSAAEGIFVGIGSLIGALALMVLIACGRNCKMKSSGRDGVELASPQYPFPFS